MARRGQDSSDKIFQRKKELNAQEFKREKERKSKIPDIIIACEDSVSSPTYFELIVENLIERKLITQDSFVIANHKHSNPSGVLEDLEKHTCDNGKKYKNFEYKWIVIDRDTKRVNSGGHSREDFNRALQSAKKLKVEVAYSNDSFELWYLLHFAYRNTAILRDDIVKEVIRHLKNKNQHKFARLNKDNIKQENFTKLIFNELAPLQEVAIKNAKKLLLSYGTEHNPENDNPSTTVHLLVELLNKLIISSICHDKQDIHIINDNQKINKYEKCILKNMELYQYEIL